MRTTATRWGVSLAVANVAQGALIHDEECGLVYDRRRYVSPSTGRFMARDPRRYVDGLNLYQYERSSPIKYQDPMGTDTDPDSYWQSSPPPLPKCCSGKGVKWTGSWSIDYFAAFFARATGDFEFTGTDTTGCIYRTKGDAGPNYLSAGAVIGVGYFTHTFKVKNFPAPVWPINAGDGLTEITGGAGGAVIIPVSLSKSSSIAGKWFSDDEWWSTSGFNLFAGGDGISVDVHNIMYQVH